MAVAGVHASAVDSTFLRDSHSRSPRSQEDGGRRGTRSSSLLQMWRELEDEHVVRQVQGRSDEVSVQQRSDGLVLDASQENMNHMSEDAVLGDNDSETWSQSQSQNGSQYEQDQVDLNNSSRENSSGIGDVGRERVRKVFKEWMSSGGSRVHASNITRGNSGSRGELRGKTEQERVSVVRQWVETSSQLRGVSVGLNREEQSAEFSNQTECVHDGLVVNQNEGQSEHISRRRIRKLHGRHFMVDIVKKTVMEREREFQELLERRAVSRFPHRNRIQALLRGRFLRNDRPIDNNRPTSIAESELGLLRQKQTVSCLREGFSFRKDNLGYGQAASNLSDTSSDSDIDVDTVEQTGASSSQLVASVHSEQSNPNNKGRDRPGISCSHEEETRNWESSSNISVERRDGTAQNVDTMPIKDTGNDLTQPSLQIEVTDHSIMQEQEPSEAHIEQSLMGDESNLSNHNNHVGGNIVDNVDSVSVVSTALEREQEEETIIESEGSEWHQTNREWRDSPQESVDDNHHSSTSNEWPQNILQNDDGDDSRTQEQVSASEAWQEDGSFQEAVEIWLGGPSDNGAAPVGRIHGFYFPEDDNVYSVELRELLSRRSVSNLLRSSFRESLDQLIQSYVERQGHAHVEWEELQETTPSSPSTEQDVDQHRRDQIVGTEDIVNSSRNLPLPPPTPPPLPSWDRHSHHDNLSRNGINNQRRGNVHSFAGHNHFPLADEWDSISDLRIDMVRLQQRMNNMQRMLEACMDMQLELQRSIRQEVSAALNRPTCSSGVHDHVLPDNKTNWECVRKGVCCICCEGSIDCLLYRCGHMCTCSKCANQLLDSRRKCPMCRAPVVEVVRAYSI